VPQKPLLPSPQQSQDHTPRLKEAYISIANTHLAFTKRKQIYEYSKNGFCQTEKRNCSPYLYPHEEKQTNVIKRAFSQEAGCAIPAGL